MSTEQNGKKAATPSPERLGSEVVPTKQPCSTCGHFLSQREGRPYCKSLKDQVEEWWTGCNRWVPNKVI